MTKRDPERSSRGADGKVPPPTPARKSDSTRLFASSRIGTRGSRRSECAQHESRPQTASDQGPSSSREPRTQLVGETPASWAPATTRGRLRGGWSTRLSQQPCGACCHGYGDRALSTRGAACNPQSEKRARSTRPGRSCASGASSKWVGNPQLVVDDRRTVTPESRPTSRGTPRRSGA